MNINSLNTILDSSFDQPVSIAEIIERISVNSPQHAPLYFVIANAWSTLTGSDLVTIRLLSVYFGMLGVSFTFRLAMLTTDRDVALYAMFFATFLAFFVYYTQSARMYSLLPLVSTWLAWSYWRVLSPLGRIPRWAWLSLFASSATILYVHYFGIITLLAIGIYHVLLPRRNKRWLKICFVVLAAGLAFVPWIPVAIFGLNDKALATGRLDIIGSLRVMISIFSNGVSILLLALAAATIRYRRRLNVSQKYILILVLLQVALFVIANEFTLILVERRMRYTLLFSLIWSCAIAIALSLLPYWKSLRFPILIVWVVAFISYTGSEDLFTYTNRKALNFDKVSDFQILQYDPAFGPIHRDSILVLDPDKTMPLKIIQYYLSSLTEWQNFIYMAYGESGELKILSSDWKYTDLESITDANQGLWLIYNPQFTRPQSLDVYMGWLVREYRPCRRYYENYRTVVQLYVKRPLPCELLIDESPLTVRYDNGMQLENIVHQLEDGHLTFFLWWSTIIDDQYAVSLQIFDGIESKAQQFDAEVGGDPIDIFNLDVSQLDPGEYVVRLILYEIDSLKSQAGTIITSEQRFERASDIVRFSIDD